MARQAVIVSTARTPIGRAFRGAFNLIHGADLAAHPIRAAIERAGIEPGDVEDVILGCGLPGLDRPQRGAGGGDSRRLP